MSGFLIFFACRFSDAPSVRRAEGADEIYPASIPYAGEQFIINEKLILAGPPAIAPFGACCCKEGFHFSFTCVQGTDLDQPGCHPAILFVREEELSFSQGLET